MDAKRCARWAGLCLLSLACATALSAQSLRIEDLGDEPVPVPGIGNAELSGITWAGGARYLAVDDGRSRLFPLDVTIDEASGKITRVVAGEFVSLEGHLAMSRASRGAAQSAPCSSPTRRSTSSASTTRRAGSRSAAFCLRRCTASGSARTAASKASRSRPTARASGSGTKGRSASMAARRAPSKERGCGCCASTRRSWPTSSGRIARSRASASWASST